MKRIPIDGADVHLEVRSAFEEPSAQYRQVSAFTVRVIGEDHADSSLLHSENVVMAHLSGDEQIGVNVAE